MEKSFSDQHVAIPGMDFGHNYESRLSRGHHKSMYSAPKEFLHAVYCSMVMKYESQLQTGKTSADAVEFSLGVFDENEKYILHSMNANPEDSKTIRESFRKKIPLFTYFLDKDNEQLLFRSEQGVVLLEKKTQCIIPIREKIPEYVEQYKLSIREELASKQKPGSLATQKKVLRELARHINEKGVKFKAEHVLFPVLMNEEYVFNEGHLHALPRDNEEPEDPEEPPEPVVLPEERPRARIPQAEDGSPPGSPDENTDFEEQALAQARRGTGAVERAVTDMNRATENMANMLGNVTAAVAKSNTETSQNNATLLATAKLAVEGTCATNSRMVTVLEKLQQQQQELLNVMAARRNAVAAAPRSNRTSRELFPAGKENSAVLGSESEDDDSKKPRAKATPVKTSKFAAAGKASGKQAKSTMFFNQNGKEGDGNAHANTKQFQTPARKTRGSAKTPATEPVRRSTRRTKHNIDDSCHYY
ncbi:expressed unknown protein [Seminavis robusta]|uniref:Uncharacterized protein n=1 Tax=Seminavis robusta TaxID=568900 RepID=A0A9N8ERJ9_9STRA|nr:expressed unknown protein [Seminavis robusta]|eukprot:Sro1754_g295460.1 n/a (475) ;mRNA; r:13596-15172